MCLLASQSSVGKDNSSNNRKVIDADSIDADLNCTITNQGYLADFVECGVTWYGYVTSVKPAQKAATYKGQPVKEDTPAYQSKDKIILATEHYVLGTYPCFGDPVYKSIIDEKKQQWATDERTKYNTYTWMQDWDGKYNVSITGTNGLHEHFGRY